MGGETFIFALSYLGIAGLLAAAVLLFAKRFRWYALSTAGLSIIFGLTMAYVDGPQSYPSHFVVVSLAWTALALIGSSFIAAVIYVVRSRRHAASNS